MLSASTVANYLGQGDNLQIVALAGEHLPIVTSFVSAYTRDNGFTAQTPNPDLEAVIIAVTARSVSNPTNVRQQSGGPFSVTPAVAGFTLPELFVLNRYRKRAG